MNVCVYTCVNIYTCTFFLILTYYHDTLSHFKHVLTTELQPSPDAILVRFPPLRDLEGLGNQNLDGRMGVSLWLVRFEEVKCLPLWNEN